MLEETPANIIYNSNIHLKNKNDENFKQSLQNHKNGLKNIINNYQIE